MFTVLVTDNGTPPLSAAQSFTVRVLEVPNEFVLRFGSTNVLAGQNGTVPVELQGTLDLTNLTAVLQTPADRLTNLTLVAVSPDTVGTVLQPAGPNQYSVSVTLNPGLSPVGTHTLAELGFLAVPHPLSAFVPLTVTAPAGLVSDGQPVERPAAISGRVAIIGNEPLLDTGLATNGAHRVTVFGKPWHGYQLQFSTNGTTWHDVHRLPLTNTLQTLQIPAAASRTVFYRTFELPPSPPIVDITGFTPGNLSLVVYGATGSNYVLQTVHNLGGAPAWQPFLSYSLTNSFRFVPALLPTSQPTFFRIQSAP